MRDARGLPIAAYLGVLVALALAAAFVAVIAIVIWLPPRPPDVMRTDIIADHFQAGYDHMNAVGRPLSGDEMVWSVREQQPERSEEAPRMRVTEAQLAQRLDLTPRQVVASATQIARNDVFVFRVRDAAPAHVSVGRNGDMHIEHRDGEGRVITQDIEGGAERIEIPLGEGRRIVQYESQTTTTTAEGGQRAPRVRAGAPTRVIVNGEVVELPRPPRPATPATVPAPAAPPEVPNVPMFAPAPAGVLLLSGFEIGAQLPDGRWLVMRQGRNWEELGWIGRAALVIGGTMVVLFVLGALFARRLTRPIRNFSDAVQAVGVDPQNEPVREEGPQELRGAARAVNSMQARLRNLIADRTKTLAAVAHDMRTPLMRLRLAAENVAPEQRERMAKEIEEVEALVASFIAFARDDPAEEARVRLDLAALLQSLADDHAEQNRNVSYAGDERLIITAQSLGLKRLFSNLVENALKYGGCARITMTRDGASVIVDVQDDGPGVPSDQRESVFEPFVRLNEGKGGAGLGLPAARSIARAHGGDIVILDGERGALMRVTLPG
jgi:two-component system OmpR family sensor kinase